MSGDVRLGQTLALEIMATGRRGDGIAYVNGFVVFVRGTALGQTVQARITKVASTFAIAEKVEPQ